MFKSIVCVVLALALLTNAWFLCIISDNIQRNNRRVDYMEDRILHMFYQVEDDVSMIRSRMPSRD